TTNLQQRFDESFHEAWDRYKDLLRACPHHGFTELHQLDTFYNALNPVGQDSLNFAAGGNLLERRTQDVLTIIENKSKCCDYRHDCYSQTISSNPPPASIKAIEEICFTCGGAHPYYQCLAADGNTFPEFRDNIQGYVSAAAVNYNQGAARHWLEKEPPRSILTWEDLVSKFINEFFPPQERPQEKARLLLDGDTLSFLFRIRINSSIRI
nr:reverse transcriptase domain-containing protein [Tanacetum cinerariifolium]